VVAARRSEAKCLGPGRMKHEPGDASPMAVRAADSIPERPRLEHDGLSAPLRERRLSFTSLPSTPFGRPCDLETFPVKLVKWVSNESGSRNDFEASY
jgi:hypothetical protein